MIMSFWSLISILSIICSIVGLFISDKFNSNRWAYAAFTCVTVMACGYAVNYNSEIARLSNNIIKKAQEKITDQLANPQKKMSVEEAERLCTQFAKFADNLQAEVQVELENLIENTVQKNADEIELSSD